MKPRSVRLLLVATSCLPLLLNLSCGSGTHSMPLKKGYTLVRSIRGEEVHTYRCALREGDLLDILVEQAGVDIVLSAYGPDDRKVAEADNRPGTSGREYLQMEASADGTHLVEVRSASPSAPGGRYGLFVRNLLTAGQYQSRQMEVDPQTYERDYANFELAPEHLVSIGPMDELGHGGRLVYLDTSTRRFGKIYELGSGGMYSAPTLDDLLTAETEIRMLRNEAGDLTAMEWRERGGPKITAPRIFPSRTEEVSFDNGDVTLSGILIIPEGPGPHPAAVYVHGSGPSLRHNGFFHSFFQRHGFAVLAFDKRGAGKSSGNWRTSSFDDLASDVLAGVEYLKSRADVHPARIGLYGISQAGWVGSLAASRSTDVKFLIINTGSGVSVADNMAHELEGALRNAGLPGDQILEAREFYRTLLHLASDGEPWKKISDWIAGARDKPWLGKIRLAELPEDNINWSWLRMNGNYDSADALEKVKCSVLWFLGDRDWNVPSAVSEARIRAALDEGGNGDFTIFRLSPAAHVLFESETGFADDVFQTSTKFVAGYWDVMDGWLDKLVGSWDRSGNR